MDAKELADVQKKLYALMPTAEDMAKSLAYASGKMKEQMPTLMQLEQRFCYVSNLLRGEATKQFNGLTRKGE